MIFHWSLSDRKHPSHLSSWTFPSIRGDFNRVVACYDPNSSTSPVFLLFSRPIGTLPKEPTIFGITVIFMPHVFFSSLARFKYLSVFFLISFIFSLWTAGTAKSSRLQVLFFLLLDTNFGLQVRIWWSFWISNFWISNSFSWRVSGWYKYHLSAWPSFNFWQISPQILLPTKSCLCRVGWGCRIHRLHLRRRLKLPQRVSYIWHWTIWRRYSSNTGAMGNAEYLFIAIAPMFTLARNNSTW